MYDTVVFEGPPKTEQTLWPRHCVQESWGAELHKDLKVSDRVNDGRMTDKCINTSGPPQWSSHTQGSSSGH